MNTPISRKYRKNPAKKKIIISLIKSSFLFLYQLKSVQASASEKKIIFAINDIAFLYAEIVSDNSGFFI